MVVPFSIWIMSVYILLITCRKTYIRYDKIMLNKAKINGGVKVKNGEKKINNNNNSFTYTINHI